MLQYIIVYNTFWNLFNFIHYLYLINNLLHIFCKFVQLNLDILYDFLHINPSPIHHLVVFFYYYYTFLSFPEIIYCTWYIFIWRAKNFRSGLKVFFLSWERRACIAIWITLFGIWERKNVTFKDRAS